MALIPVVSKFHFYQQIRLLLRKLRDGSTPDATLLDEKLQITSTLSLDAPNGQVERLWQETSEAPVQVTAWHNGLLPSLQAATYWPSLSETIALPGIWTREGNVVLGEWIEQIERAIGHPLSIFQQTKARWSTLRQDAWRQYLIEVSASLSPVPPAAMSRGHLIALGQNQSKAMQFVARTLSELDDIPTPQAQPWLETLRQLQQLAMAGNSPAMLRRVTHMDNRMRLSLTSWLQGTPTKTRTDSAPSAEQVWNQWQSIRNEAVKEAVAQGKAGEHLTRGLFAKDDNSDRNPLTELFPTLASIQERLTPQNDDASIAAVWLLYKDDAYRLLANAMFQSACWLNTQWKSAVLWPLGKDEEQPGYEELQALSQQSVSDFLRGPAKTLLIVGNNGPDAANYAGMKIPLTAEFLRLIRHTFPLELLQNVPQRKSTRESDLRAALQVKVTALELQQNALEKKIWKITVASQPATVPGGAQVIPTGTQLTLSCLKNDQQLSSMNFAEKYDFSWQPGQCTGVTLSVIFPDFSVKYQLNGDDAWPEFINRFTSGEALLENNNFGNSAGLLEQMGIKHILVRFAVSDQQEMNTAWQAWSERSKDINTLNARIAVLDDSSGIQHVNPLSALPNNIAQCQ